MNSQQDNFNSLSRYIVFVFALLFLLTSGFLFRWQILEKEQFNAFAQSRFKSRSISSIRGDILARDGTSLAYSEIRYDVFVYMVDLRNAETRTKSRLPLQTREEFIRKVSTVLNISSEELESSLAINSNWIKIGNQVDIETKELLEKIHSDLSTEEKQRYLVGLNFEVNPKRIYPEGQTASHILGFLGKDLNSNDIGRGGLEQKYNGTLREQEGFVAGETDKFGNIIAISDSVSIRAKRGSTLQSTIDPTLQRILERKIQEGVEQYEALSGYGVIIDPKTGEVLAIANFPTYKPEEYFKEQQSNVFTNKAISIPFEVGSIAKIFTMAAAIEELNIKPTDIIIEGHEGCREIVGSTPRDIREICTFDKQPRNAMTATEAFISSDNLAFVELGEKLGKEAMYRYLKNFGVGSLSQIDLTGESIGLLPELSDPKAWHPIDIAVFSFGHGYQMNLTQATAGIGSIANNGWLMQPFVVSKIIDSNGTEKSFEPISVRKVLSEESSNIVSRMMELHYQDHARQGYKHLVDYPVASKSGTALIPHKDKAGYSSDVNATYVGFDTSESKHFVMGITLEAPQAVDKLSFYSVRHTWFEVYDEIKDYYNIAPRN
jgi:cell division protein FtsI (penicillin-binding protein 3)